PPTSYSPEIAIASSKIATVSPENLLEKVAADLPKIADSPEKIAATAANATPPEIIPQSQGPTFTHVADEATTTGVRVGTEGATTTT
ncbi:hypothetical protein Tco_1379636, partial [Tanacetum coccineum]